MIGSEPQFNSPEMSFAVLQELLEQAIDQQHLILEAQQVLRERLVEGGHIDP